MKGSDNMKEDIVRYAYIYLRISSHNQVGNNSMNAQEEAIRQYAKEHNIKIIGVYKDVAKSGTSIIHRPGYQKMMSDLEKHPEVKDIIVHNLDRLHRNAREQHNMIYELKVKGIGILTTSGLNTLDEDCMSDILDEAADAEKYSRRLSKETMKGLKVNAEKMLHNGGTPPYGYVVGPDKKLILIWQRNRQLRRSLRSMPPGLATTRSSNGSMLTATRQPKARPSARPLSRVFWRMRSTAAITSELTPKS